MGNAVYVGNASSHIIRCRISRDMLNFKKFGSEDQGGFLPDPLAREDLIHQLDLERFQRLKPHEVIKLNLPRGEEKPLVYVTIVDDAVKRFHCYNYSPLVGWSIIFTDYGTTMVQSVHNELNHIKKKNKSKKYKQTNSYYDYTDSSCGIVQTDGDDEHDEEEEREGDEDEVIEDGAVCEGEIEGGWKLVSREGDCYFIEMATEIFIQLDSLR